MESGKKLLAGLAALLLGSIPAMSQAPAEAATQDSEGAEVLTRGPVHEAFAGAVTYNAEAGIIIATKPPGPIDEIPPDQKPVGDNVAWIPGYWAWDEDQSDFLWISGIWRNLPPGREWVPGYWAEVDTRYQWTSGYWQDAKVSEVEYLPEPPKTLESGPNIESPGDSYSWVPGNWMYSDNRYAWRAGYWAEGRDNWVWTPACYRWTHRGYVYVDGYWDYGVASRGVLFAPVYVNRSYYSRPNYCYTPSTVISVSVFSDHLFLRPNYSHYYFGDYYAPRYRGYGYYPSYFYHASRRGCDPIYAHYSWQHRHDRNWERGRREYFEYRRDNEGARPPRTWDAYGSRPDRERNFMAQRYDRFVGSRGDGRQEFRSIAGRDRDRLVSQRQEMRQFTREREQREARRDRPADQARQVSRSEIRRSPLVAQRTGRQQDTPPRRLEEARAGQARQQAGRQDRPAIASRDSRPQDGRRADGGQSPGRQASPGRQDQSRGQANQGRGNREEQARQTPSQRGVVPAPNRALARRTEANNGQASRIVPRPSQQQTNTRRDATPSQRVTPPRGNAQRQDAVRPKPQRQQVQRPQAQPQRQQIQRSQPQPQRQQIQRSQPQPQRQQIQRSQPQPQRQQIQRSQPQPQRQQIQRSQPQPQRQQIQRSQPQPQRQQIQRSQPQPQRQQIQRSRPQPQRQQIQRPQPQRQQIQRAQPQRQQMQRAQPQRQAAPRQAPGRREAQNGERNRRII